MASSIELQGDKVRLRPVREDDLESFLHWLHDTEVTQYLNASPPDTLDDERQWFAEMLKKNDEHLFSIELTQSGKLIGNCVIRDFLNSYEVHLGLFIGDKTEWGKGYGTETTRLLVDYAKEILKVYRVWLLVDVDNKAGIRCYEKAGFHIVKKQRSNIRPDKEEYVMEL